MTALMLRRRAMKAPSSAFSPSDIAGLQLWLKADAITGLVNGDPVGQWNDESGAARHLTQATAAQRPTYQTNVVSGKPVVSFDGVDDSLRGSAAVIFKHAFAVVNVGEATFGDYDGVLTGINNTDDNIVLVGEAITARFHNASITTVYHRDGTAEAETAMSAPMQAWGICSISFATGWDVTPQLGTDRINSARFLLGKIAEVICYNNVLSDADRRRVESHLGTKYGITVT